MRDRFVLLLAAAFVACVTLARPGHAQRAWVPPTPHAIENVALGLGDDAPRGTVVLRDGRIESVLPAGAKLPAGLRRIDGAELICLPAFVDAYTTVGVETPEPVIDRDHPLDAQADVRIDMRIANRKGFQPSFDAVDVAELDDDRLEAYRAAGFGAALQSPERQLLSGHSVLVSLRDAALRERVIRAQVFAHSAFRASGSGYPSTLMGYISALRQFFLDVRWHQELNQRYDAGRPGPRPAFDADLEAGRELLSGDRRLMCEAQSSQDIRRFARCAAEMGFTFGIVGGREAHEALDVFEGAGRPLVLTLEFGNEPDDPRPKDAKEDTVSEEEAPEPEAAEPIETTLTDDQAAVEELVETDDSDPASAGDDAADDSDADDDAWVYTEPYPVSLDRRVRWEQRRDGALRLAEAGVEFALGTSDEGPAGLLKNLRGLVERGLPQQTALDALTTVPAKWLGAEGRLGVVAAGADATLCLWSANPLVEKDAKVLWLFVDGYAWRNDEALEERD
ncbi:hypothetical protein [Engelhardtia mirabilis]|uniref:Amidohydrolase-related domain-containing protein n=1 Tax=Engelhardtia mirabilis TaxID=2528011 RepID=A0A518BFR1_9BACT|nr:hypothetical protein Pla133_08850 [Planctomycetes bacterium Pla133]QDV00145.1 hypothetical protein Pla86_08840 [Planctomycetes bacterium Pla86]